MSGIFGFWNVQTEKTISSKKIKALAAWNKMYGTDGFDSISSGTYGIGCHMEHISDRIFAGTPIIQDGEYQVVLDAVIYNRSELFDFLQIQESREIADEALLWRLIKTGGYTSLALVNGDFAGAVYDEKKEEWTLFRDHMGIRPLFYYIDKDQFVFSTDMRGILALPGINKQINEKKLYLHMMGYNDLTLCETDFAEIKCIMPASYTRIQKGSQGFEVEVAAFWKMKQKKIRRDSEKAYIEEFRTLITDAIQRRMDVVSGPIGAELSGGLDSGVISILIHRLGHEGKYFSWSVSPEKLSLQDGDDERKVIFDICAQEHITCEFTDTDKQEAPDHLFEQVAPPYINTGNLSDSAAYLKSQGAKVIFTGHGGDEGVSHRTNPSELWYHKEYGSFLKLFWVSTKGQKLRLARTAKRAWRFMRKEYPLYFEPYENGVIYSKEFLNPAFKQQMKEVKSPMLYFSIDPAVYYAQGGPRVRLDNVAYHGAKYGMRYMVPFLDYRVFDFAVSIPRRFYLQKGLNRYIYREAFKDIMPESLYKMRYKDTASQRNYKFQPDVREKFIKRFREITNRLDRSYWEKYLDFDTIEQFVLKEGFNKSDYMKAVFKLHDLTVCCMIQNVIENAAKWYDENEE